MRGIGLILVASAVAGYAAACSGTPLDHAATSRELAKQLGTSLAKLAGREDLKRPIFKDGIVVVSGQSVQVSPISEQSMNSPFMEAAMFEVRIDSTLRPELSFGVIGIGESRQDAIETAVDEWYGLFGAALFSALADTPTKLTAGRFVAYPGGSGFRGEPPKGTWVDGSDEMHRRILATVIGHLSGGNGALRTLDLKVAINPDGPVDGEARIDAAPSDAALTAIKGLDWPRSTSYMFKQAYVLKPVAIVESVSR